MKDIMGNPIELGDEVIMHNIDCMYKGIVKKFTKKSIVCELPKHVRGINYVAKGSSTSKILNLSKL